jgi:hypothetical protein
MSAHRIPRDLSIAPIVVNDPGNAGTIYVDRSPLEVEIINAGAETRTLAAPIRASVFCKLSCVTASGNTAITVKDSAAATTGLITFTAAGQWVTLESFCTSYTASTGARTYAWQVTAIYGPTNTITGTATNGAALTAPVISGGLTASGSTSNDFSGSTGTFKTSAGVNTLSGNTVVASGKGFSLDTTAVGTPVAGGLTGDKTALTKQISVLTCSDASHVFFKLPAPNTFQSVVLVNSSAQAADIYPSASETIKNTTHLTIAAYTAAIFWTDGTNWFTQVSG